jgi:hypothetical protein
MSLEQDEAAARGAVDALIRQYTGVDRSDGADGGTGAPAWTAA